MKLSAEIDLAALRLAAARRIDAHFEALARAVDPIPTIRAALARAFGGADGAEQDAIDAAILAHNTRRIIAHSRLAGMTDERAIAAFLAQLESQG